MTSCTRPLESFLAGQPTARRQSGRTALVRNRAIQAKYKGTNACTHWRLLGRGRVADRTEDHRRGERLPCWPGYLAEGGLRTEQETTGGEKGSHAGQEFITPTRGKELAPERQALGRRQSQVSCTQGAPAAEVAEGVSSLSTLQAGRGPPVDQAPQSADVGRSLR